MRLGLYRAWVLRCLVLGLPPGCRRTRIAGFGTALRHVQFVTPPVVLGAWVEAYDFFLTLTLGQAWQGLLK